MAPVLKAFVVFDGPATLRELLTAALQASIELLPLRDRRAAINALAQQSDACALIVEQSTKAGNPLEILQNAQIAQPKLRRIIVTDSSDLSPVIAGLHSGTVDALVYRPVDPRQLLEAVTGVSAAAIRPAP